MEVIIDKFGRILIPENIRKILNLHTGRVLKLMASENSLSLEVVPESPIPLKLTVTDSGIPIFETDTPQQIDFDVVDWIKQDREERDDKILGL